MFLKIRFTPRGQNDKTELNRSTSQAIVDAASAVHLRGVCHTGQDRQVKNESEPTLHGAIWRFLAPAMTSISTDI
ncbi:MAG: hypothetical protein Q7S58_06730 [Candidatus Binatus sp.]|uniref:hypothetical protein n=1 Tax=Candidatus Binatus sp. TaxID=2811406 RepID=UPI00271F794F|nr:hypothetical protein [Candidatus Binatus sp.]MDO8432092.1 hypothetical protein [Candidatus Binatus sp.]